MSGTRPNWSSTPFVRAWSTVIAARASCPGTSRRAHAADDPGHVAVPDHEHPPLGRHVHVVIVDADHPTVAVADERAGDARAASCRRELHAHRALESRLRLARLAGV